MPNWEQPGAARVPYEQDLDFVFSDDNTTPTLYLLSSRDPGAGVVRVQIGPVTSVQQLSQCQMYFSYIAERLEFQCVSVLVSLNMMKDNDCILALTPTWPMQPGEPPIATLDSLKSADPPVPKSAGAAVAHHFATVLTGNTTLRSLDFSYNKIGPTGAQHLAAAFTGNTTLTSLHLNSNKIDPMLEQYLCVCGHGGD